ncbi:molybdopterin dehydrogenase [Moorella thermoacetica]|uniref:Aerobic-type carbon monoxide dehydrogenase, middle subunit CoxM/CutM homologs n=2 Tax=Neomoorella thermoacetica TaxID=1525 RepID=A0A0S6U819_NEOTH|nr:xanthine dehydrogenase family protein subunit M [Moorella thermoacetica]AKX94778.1 6-hydroxypseudooxynicotine dehydrogenase complex subunit alpha [Moorella thermoacetica]AKX97410.1 6-hydroxypseudooxynicotine dehydrogenase complex subunit alpha [Moorella thermoacetica]OIQ57171.1 6-hydroxypseudooxynicotine dehydrogenase complex subunit alpha [Moorella thermoacetica]QDA01237.1 6-hydroxypseudooxynicotine dehydrogenase complex subunit alpha [Moorella thermoacetica]TYL10397.1 6-hydroxypseudooxyni
MPEKYLFATSPADCLALLAANPGARLIAGGTDLVIDLKEKRRQVTTLVDITRIPELKIITETNGKIILGGAATHTRVATSSLIRQKLPALAAAAAAVGSPQVRNVGTLAGNVVNAQPAADTAVALVALGAVATILGAEGERQVPVADLYAGVGRSLVDAGREIITRFTVDLWGEGESSAFVRLSPRRALSLPMLNVAVRVQVREGICTRARISIAPVAPRPFLCEEAAASLVGREPTAKAIARAASVAKEAARPRDSLLRGSGAYRKDMTAVLVARALSEAFSRATSRKIENDVE